MITGVCVGGPNHAKTFSSSVSPVRVFSVSEVCYSGIYWAGEVHYIDWIIDMSCKGQYRFNKHSKWVWEKL